MDKVKNALLKAGNFVKTKASSLSKKVLIGLVSGVAVVVVSLIVLAIILGQTRYAVLYKDVSNAEVGEILTYARETLGITDIKQNANGDILVPQDRVEEIRADMSMGGFPKSTFNYDIWNSGSSMFSTQTELLELQKQQLQNNLMATLKAFDGVYDAIVLLNISDNDPYVISTSKTESSAGVTLSVRGDLTAEQIDGMYNLIANSVPGLSRDNITITDQTGRQLFAVYDDGDETDNELKKMELFYQRRSYSDQLKRSYEDSIRMVMENTFEEVNVSVGLNLDFNNEVLEQIDYYSNSYDEDGNPQGIASEEHWSSAAGGIAAEGGLIGTTTNADISPDYPTLTVGEDGEFYQEASHDIIYKISETRRQVEKDGYSIAGLSAAVVVKSNVSLTNEEENNWRSVIANAIGADVANVSIQTAPFIESTGNVIDGSSIQVSASATQSMAMLLIIVVLGIILIILLVLSLRSPGIRKKQRKGGGSVPAAAGAGASGGYAPAGADGMEAFGMAAAVQNNDDFELLSLSEEQPETRDEALKREIQDFSKQNPEIVAQLIRSLIRSDD